MSAGLHRNESLYFHLIYLIDIQSGKPDYLSGDSLAEGEIVTVSLLRGAQ
jgi:hypothetical protein